MEKNKLSDTTDEDAKGYTERYIRWQETRLRQLGYVNNLLLVLSSGSLLWQAQSMLIVEITLLNRPLYFLSAALFFTSIIIGCWVAWTRLGDFTLTADRLKSKMAEPPSIAGSDTKKLRNEIKDETEKLGKMTRRLLSGQFYTFIAGFLLVALDIVYHVF